MSSSTDDWTDRLKSIAGWLVNASARERLAVSFAALIASLLVGAVIILVAGYVAECSSGFLSLGGGTFCYNPVEVYYQLFVTSFITCSGGLLTCTFAPFNLALMLKEMTLLLFSGLSVAVAFRAGLFNIGTQGQLVVGGLATALGVLWVAPFLPGGLIGVVVLVPLGLLLGASVGGLYGALPGALKAYAEANEVITTIMLNFVATSVAFYLVSTYFQDPASQSIETESLPAAAQLTPVLPPFANSTFSLLAFVTALALVAGVYYMLFHTAFGYDLRISGIQPGAAAYGGVKAKRLTVASMTISGALGGLAGAVYVMMVLGRWRTGIPAIGFDGITVSILASNNPLGVVPAALLFGILKSGSLSISFALGVPKQLVGVLRGLIILFVAMPEFFRMLGRRWGLADEEVAVAADGGRTVDESAAADGGEGDD